jgi:hypothetical protein
MEYPILVKLMWRAALSSASTPFCLFSVVWWWSLELLLLVATLACFSLVVWEQLSVLFSFVIYLTFFCSSFFLISLFFFTGLSTT